MKIKSFFNTTLLCAFTLGIVACEPIEDSTEYKNDFTPEEIELSVSQVTEGSNGITLKMVTPGVTGYWDYNLDQQYTDEVSFNYPIPGEATFTFHATTPYATDKSLKDRVYAEKSVTVNITNLDQELPQQYYDLVGTDLEGKTWVFDGTQNDERLWWYMCEGNNPAKYEGVWWNAGGTCCPPYDFAGKMVFDLDGAANYTYYESPEATPVTGGSWKFNKDFTKITITGEQKILGNEAPRGNPDGEYVIISLTSSQMILYVNTNEGGTGWVWKFKPMDA